MDAGRPTYIYIYFVIFAQHKPLFTAGTLSPRGQRCLEAKIFPLGLVPSGLVLVLMYRPLMLASFSRRLSSWPSFQSSKSRHSRHVLPR